MAVVPNTSPQLPPASPPDQRLSPAVYFQSATSAAVHSKFSLVVFAALSGAASSALAQATGGAAPAAGTAGAGSIAASVYAPTSSGGGMIWLTFITLVLLAGVVVLIAWLVHKNMTSTVPSSSIRILSVQSLGPRERIVIASVVGRVYVLGHTANQISLIAELSPQEVAGLSSSPAPMDFAARLSELLRKPKK